MKKTGFVKDFRESLELLAPYLILCAVAIAALTSQGSWAHFFDKSFPRWLGLMTALWLFLGLYFASVRRRGSVAGWSADDEGVDIQMANPATGLPMTDGFDSAGNPSGSDYLS